ncbi:MAG: acyl-CoA dehydrogenase family protein [Chloroflexota bacterium]
MTPVTTQAPATAEAPACPQDVETVMKLLGAAAEPWLRPSFLLNLFHGRLQWDLIHPFPQQPEGDRQAGVAVLEAARAFLLEHIDPLQIDAAAALPDDYLDLIRASGLLRLTLPEPRGYGLSYSNLVQVIELAGSWSSAVAMSISVHNCLGAPAFLSYLQDAATRDRIERQLGKGAISGLAATEQHGASNIVYCAAGVPTDDGSQFVLNGDKVYIGNGPIADLLVVPVNTTPAGETQSVQLSAFVVETDRPGVSVASRQQYMGLRGLSNGVVRFDNVVVPRENMLGQPGEGLKVVVDVVAAGKIFIPAICLAGLKHCLSWSARFAENQYLELPLSAFQLTQDVLADLAAEVFAQQSLLEWVARSLDDPRLDLRLELSVIKTCSSEAAWRAVDRTMQLCAGRGYEAARSLAARGLDPMPVERFFRDLRVHRIFGTTNELLHLSNGQAALAVFSALLAGQLTPAESLAHLHGLLNAAPSAFAAERLSAANRAHLRYIERTARRLAWTNYQLLLRGGGLAEVSAQQDVLLAIGQISALLCTMAITLSKADAPPEDAKQGDTIQQLADHFCARSATQIEALFRRLEPADGSLARMLSQTVASGAADWLLDGALIDDPKVSGARA